MKKFLDGDFLLKTETAKRLYHSYAEELPIIDYHCHLNPKEIYEDKRFENITELWLGGDHYKWRLMRSFGIEERFITGDAPDKEKFFMWVKALETAIGNPLYHWSHLELKNYFGYEGVICEENAEEIWNLCAEKLKQADFSARKLIERSGVEVVCTTDDPADDLIWHKKIAESDFSVKVLPSFRPDKALGIEKADYLDYISRLGDIKTFAQLKTALSERLDYFVSLGCKVSDHGLEAVPFAPANEAEIEAIFAKKIKGESLSTVEINKFKTAWLLFLCEQYKKKNIVMQIHFGVIRDLSERVYNSLGADAGIDAIGDKVSLKDLASFLNAADKNGNLPKTIIYSLNPEDNAAIDSIIGAFQTSEAKGKIQHGSAWWFNDHKKGMTEQLSTLASEGHLATFIGMLTDSRSFLSYARHEYFRRILCDIIGEQVETGEYPENEKLLKEIVENISYYNAKEYFEI